MTAHNDLGGIGFQFHIAGAWISDPACDRLFRANFFDPSGLRAILRTAFSKMLPSHVSSVDAVIDDHPILQSTPARTPPAPA